MNFGIVTNTEKDRNNIFSEMVKKSLSQNHCNIIFSASLFEIDKIESRLLSLCEFVYVLGGDGTIMTAARMLSAYGIKIIGVNLGHLGYLTEIDIKDIDYSIQCLTSGKFIVDKRLMLDAEIFGKSKMHTIALNDIVVSHENVSRLVDMEISVNGEIIDHYLADGIIVSTPTGSTAYSLSAGGPIIFPQAKCILITPICPHSLTCKSLVLNECDEIKIRLISDSCTAVVSGDGQTICNININDKCIIKKSDLSAKFVRFDKINFFNLLRNKMNNVGELV